MLWLLWFWKIEWGNYVLILLRKMKQSTIFKLTFWTAMFLLWINFDLLYCYDISLENFTESTFLHFFTTPHPNPNRPWKCKNYAVVCHRCQPTSLDHAFYGETMARSGSRRRSSTVSQHTGRLGNSDLRDQTHGKQHGEVWHFQVRNWKVKCGLNICWSREI